MNNFHKLWEQLNNLDKDAVINQSEPVNILFNSYATDVTQNYLGNIINFLMYGRHTKTLFPIDADYLQNKFNNLVIRWNIKYNQPFKINH